MHKRNLLLTALMGAVMIMGPIGCGGGDDDENKIPVIIPQMAATFSPAGGDIPLPNDILFLGSQDLTLNPPVDDPDNFSDPNVAVSGLDGWSAVAPLFVNFNDFGSGLTLDPDSVVGGSSVRVYKVNTMRPEIAPGIIAPTGPVTSVERELTAGTEYVVQATSGTSIAIFPTVPFVQQAGYMVVVTNDLQDSNGNPVTTDSYYEVTKSQVAISPTSAFAVLEGLRPYINAMESAAEAEGIVRSDIIVSFQFTVQSIGIVMNSAKTIYIDAPLGAGAPPVLSFSDEPAGLTEDGYADIYTGTFALKYMLGIPSGGNPIAPLNTFWTAAEELPLGPGGAMVPSPLYANFGDNLSYANSYPKINSVEIVPLLVSIPNEETCTKPDNGYPVAIYQHGITSNRTAALGIADSLALNCTAVVSMDQPLHGVDESSDYFVDYNTYTPGVLRERTFGVDFINNATGAPGPDTNPDTSGAHTMNIANLQVARDNLRQATFDLLALEKAVPFMDIDGDDTADFDATKISFIGHSWGAMVGTGIPAYSDFINAAVLVNPGGGLAGMVMESQAYGPPIIAGVAGAFGMTPDDPAFGPLLQQFLWATQTVLDSADPINLSLLAAERAEPVPTLLMQNRGDTVVPNAVATAPLSGTVPMGRILGLTTLAATVNGETVNGSHIFSKINTGHHGSITDRSDIDVFNEMQNQVVTFLDSGGASLTVLNPNLLDE